MARFRLSEDDGPSRFRSGATGLIESGEEVEVSDDAVDLLESYPYLERLDAFNAERWLEPDYEERVERVESGDYDEHLDEIIEVESSQNVIDAAEERREE